MSMLGGLFNALKKFVGFTSQAITTPINGDSISLAGLIELEWLIYCSAYTSGTLNFKIQFSPDNSTWTDATSTYIRNASAKIDGDEQIASIGIFGVDLETQKYARIVTVNTVALTACSIVIATPSSKT